METSNPASKKTEKDLNTLSLITIKSPPLLISPQKMRLITGLIRHQNLDHLLNSLPFMPHKGGRLVLGLFQKETKHWGKKGLTPSDFYVHRAQTNQGRTRKKIICRAKGRADRIRGRSSLVEIWLAKNSSDSKRENRETSGEVSH